MCSTNQNKFSLIIIFLICALLTHNLFPQEDEKKNEEEILKLVPFEFKEKIKRAFESAGENKKEIFNAFKKVEDKYRDDLIFLVSQTAFRYFVQDFNKKTCDASVITADLLLTHIKLSHEARKTFPWANDIDDDTFRRFILSYRTTTEKLCDWRSYFWNHTELRPLFEKYAEEYKKAKDNIHRDKIFKEMLFKVNTEWLGKMVPYAPRGMPDLNPIEAIENKTGRCTDITNTLIAILRTYGIATTSIRVVWWPDADSNHTWTTVFNPATKEWLDIDSGQGGFLDDPKYFKRYIRDPNRKVAKVFKVTPGEENGEIFNALALKNSETYPFSIEKYLIYKPMVDVTERYSDVISVNFENLPPDTLIWLAVYNSGMWKPLIGTRSSKDGKVQFNKIGCGVRYRLMIWKNNKPQFCSPVIIIGDDRSVKTATGTIQDEISLLHLISTQLLQEGKIKEAIEVLKKLISLNPVDSDALYNLACAFSINNDKLEALDYLEKAFLYGFNNYEWAKKDPDLENIRNESRFKRIVYPKPLAEEFNITYPKNRTEIFYAIVVNEETAKDENWKKVIDAFTKKYNATVFKYSGDDPAVVLKELINYAPRYLAFITKPTETFRSFVFRARKILCEMDNDPYEDAIWGIITGFNYEDCLRMANADKLIVTKALSGFSDGWLSYFNEGLAFSEVEKNVMFMKRKNEKLEKQKCPDDTTKLIVDALNTNEYQMMTTSGHATEHDWQIGYSFRSGQIISKEGKLFGIDTTGKSFPIETTNSKIYFSPGNCLIANISDKNCMALAWIHNGVNQFFGHAILQTRECYAWGIVEYFIVLQGKWTYAESVFLHRTAATFKKTQTQCCHGTVFYGDPAWEARISKEIDPPYSQSINFNKNDNIIIKIKFNKDYTGRPAGFFLEKQIKHGKVKSKSHQEIEILILDNLILIDYGKRQKDDEIIVEIEYLE